ncbi:hypothetical protein K2X14_14070 [Acetobacter sp. TBRC 12305]|uniref:Uncharacterized protein n=1 Tax=Acetobacter garciniae TaxID=2817435 RepID=A0A939KRE6_9PROT|nr:hypothetical protein [Acetobacter garciniae]MBO1326742.1 hypothetical protein [Acetobacter garciniae]MBX0345960.1 hypothetical protein [Acetobacter garciniae]
MRILSFLAVSAGIISVVACPNAAEAAHEVAQRPPVAYGTATISLRSGLEHSSVIVLGEAGAPWEQFTEVPYTASISSDIGKKPVMKKALFRDGVSGKISAVGQQNGHVALKIDLEDTTLVKIGHATAANGWTIDEPKTDVVEFHGTIDLADGQSVPLVFSGKTIGTVSWSAMTLPQPR